MWGAALVLVLAACDPVHNDQIDALGGEAPGVRTGPLHRPGQPCTTCHDGSFGSPPEFSVAGTIFLNATDTTPAVDASVVLKSADGATFTATTNRAGNFYMTPADFTPRYPMLVSVIANGITVKMVSEIGRDASCGTCHKDPAGPTSAGHICIPADGVGP
jgi:hypothetical protein